jgi:hypothetical protein
VPDRTAELEAKVATLSEQLARFGARLAALEATRPVAARPVAVTNGVKRGRRAEAPGAADEARPGAADEARPAADPALGLVSAALSFGGRTLLVLAGAFVLRAMTDSKAMPGWLGVALGFTYAAIWIAMADRAARAGQSLSAGVHGFAALIIAYPLLFESVAKFKLLGPTGAGVALALVTTALLAVAARRRLQSLAWMATAGSILTTIGVMLLDGRMVPGTLFLVLLGFETLWLAYVRDWHGLRWPTAAVVDLAVLGLALRAVSPDAVEGPGVTMLVQVLMLAAYQASFATRTLIMHRAVVPFEVVQTIGSVAAGLGGAAYVAARTPGGSASAVAFGVAATVLGLAAYGVAFAFRGRREQDRANFPFYAAVALLLVASGTTILLDGIQLGLTWSVLAVVAAVLAGPLGRRTMAAHSAGYAVGAAVTTGLLAVTSDAIIGSAARTWTAPVGASAVALLAAGACAWLGSRGPADARPTLASRLPQFTTVALAVAGAAGLLIWSLVPPLTGGPGVESSRGAVATVRTAVLVVGTIFLAWAGRQPRWREAGWLAYPLLVASGLKILFEDLPSGRAATLFVSFGLYGAALLLVPRLRPRGSTRHPGSSPTIETPPSPSGP